MHDTVSDPCWGWGEGLVSLDIGGGTGGQGGHFPPQSHSNGAFFPDPPRRRAVHAFLHPPPLLQSSSSAYDRLEVLATRSSIFSLANFPFALGLSLGP